MFLHRLHVDHQLNLVMLAIYIICHGSGLTTSLFFIQTHIGVKGVVTDENNNPIADAEIKVTNLTGGQNKYINHDVTTGMCHSLRVDSN